ncbi:hypothetical protein J4P41_07200 [Gluconobacter sp. NFX36]|uniref:hypothetical protein n=1 Tax=Gluconobacter sp. NFX36 TaxID=2819535 RepID=UPI003CF52C93
MPEKEKPKIGYDTPEEAKASLERFQKRVDAGEPIMQYVIDQPLRIGAGQSGELVIDCPSMQFVGTDQASVVRTLMTKEAVQMFFHYIREAEKTQGPIWSEAPKPRVMD